ncbi:MAG: hypothetical protein WCL39_07085, partial [Armatimonadota bacterium]
MKRMVLIFTGLTMLLSVAIATASTWNLVGTAGFTVESPIQITDGKRPTLNSMLKDAAGNIWVSCSYEQDEVQTGQGFNPHGSGVTVFKAGGGTVNVDVKALGYLGCITKMVQGGDGAIYVLSNYSNLEWTTYNQSSLTNPGYQDYILRLKLNIDNTISVTSIYTPGPQGLVGQAIFTLPVVNKIGGMAVGGDGNIYWTQNGNSNIAPNFWRMHFFWRYDVGSQVVEEAPNRNGLVAECASETHRLLDLEYVGGDQFAIVGPYSGSNWQCNPISWTVPEVYKVENTSNPTWGRVWNTATAYDPVRKKMWVGGRGSSPYAEWQKVGAGATVVDLDAGNKGLKFVSTGATNEYNSHNNITMPVPQFTGALRFRVDSYSTDTTLLWQYGPASKTPDGRGMAVALKILGGNLKLVDLYYTYNGTGPQILADLGPVSLGIWNDIY